MKFTITIRWYEYPMKGRTKEGRLATIFDESTTLGELLGWAKYYNEDAHIEDLQITEILEHDDMFEKEP